MTRLLPRRPAPGRHREPRVPRRGRHRLRRSPRRATYAAAGLLAVSGAVTGAAALQTAERPGVVAIRPLAAHTHGPVELAPRRPRRVSRAAVRKPVYRWVVRTVDGPVLRGRATWYGPGFHGDRTASGERFDSYGALTAAHRTLPFGTRLRVCRGDRCVVVRITDRGPFGPAILDLSWLAASRIGLDRAGIGEVTATVLVTKRVRVPA
jgi:rare lipoprotein A (peptidoglycan hydrolase)